MWYRLIAQYSAPENIPKIEAGNVAGSVVNLVYWAVGVLCVIFIIIGAMKYVLSGGDSKSTESAKNTILYAVVGLVVTIMAFAITNFVLGETT